MSHTNVFSPIDPTVNLVVTGTNQVVALTIPQYGNTVRIANIGNQTVFVLLGGAATVSTTSTGFPVLPNTVETFGIGSSTHVAAIAATTGSTIYATIGTGA